MSTEPSDKRCDRCGTGMTPIAYGYPGPEMWEASERGDIALGGCVVDDGVPLWSCPGCGNTAGKLRMRDWADADDEA